MASLEELTAALRAGAQGQADLSGLDEDYARAGRMRDAPMSRPDQYGQLSPMMVMADVLRGSQGRKRMREIAPQRTAARTAVADNENAMGLYNAKVAVDKVAADKLKEGSRAKALVSAARLKNENAKAAAKLTATAKAGERDTETYIDPKTKETFTVGVNNAGAAALIDAEGKATGKDISSLIPLSEYTASQKATKKAKYGGLTAGQLQTGLKEYRKAVDPLSPIVQGVNNLNNMLADLPDANKNIPGIGRIEGGSGVGSQLVRWAGSQEGENIHAAWTQTIAPLIREQAGLAQTQTELKRVEQAYGADWLSSEETFRTAYPQIMQALKHDLETIEATFLPAVGDYYRDTMKEIGALTIFERAKFANPFDTEELADIDNMTDEELEAELAR